MGTINEKAATRAKEKGSNFDTYSGGSRDARREGEGYGTEQKRDDRTHSERASVLTLGKSITGGMLRQLIADYRDQLAAKKEEINKLENQIRQANDEAEKLQSRIQEFEALQSQLEQQIEENE
ncbi:hypothetical protein QI031_28830 [Halotia branconii CENA392]|uniref:Uncharacterized protein n=2 Tax=Halotia TaxID=1620790 RepID=A0AAJ6P9C2_9CYAN|nr:hypothetical protein [Halotia branconii]WGV25679.1 hypothetical protein QI031_28830 [Halotia branconii CENA392]